MSGFFNDHKFTILNEWSQHWSQHPDSLRNGVNNNSKLYNIDWVKGLQPRISKIMNEWILQWPQVYNFEKWSQQRSLYQHSQWIGVTNNLKSRILNEWSQQRSQHPC